MKKLSILLMFGLFSVSAFVMAGVSDHKNSGPDYIITEDGVQFFEKVRTGLFSSLTGIGESGRVSYKAEDVIAYRKDGQIYERMPVIENNRETGRYAFMELIAYRNGHKLFRHYVYEGGYPREAEYYVFRNGSYLVNFDKKNSISLNNFFMRADYSLVIN